MVHFKWYILGLFHLRFSSAQKAITELFFFGGQNALEIMKILIVTANVGDNGMRISFKIGPHTTLLLL